VTRGETTIADLHAPTRSTLSLRRSLMLGTATWVTLICQPRHSGTRGLEVGEPDGARWYHIARDARSEKGLDHAHFGSLPRLYGFTRMHGAPRVAFAEVRYLPRLEDPRWAAPIRQIGSWDEAFAIRSSCRGVSRQHPRCFYQTVS